MNNLLKPKEINMKYYTNISKYYTDKLIYITGDAEPIFVSASVPKLIVLEGGKVINIMTESRLGKEVFDSLYWLSDANCEFTSPSFSFEKGEETALAEKLNKSKYAFAYIDGKFKYFDKGTKEWRTIRYDFGDCKDQELAFKTLAQNGSFVLGLDKIAIDWYFNANDVLNNN